MNGQPPSALEMIRGLVAQPSVSSFNPDFDQGNRDAIALLGNWLEDVGFAVDIRPLPSRPDKANLVATLGAGPGGLVLSGHMDTVPFDAADWHHDPFGGEVRGDRIYGLGTADMKSFLALAVEAARSLSVKDLRQPLIILATADEESSMAGAKALVDAGRPLGRYAVIGEPTSLRPVRMHKGMMMESIQLHGRSGHSSNPALGNNALEGMHAVIGSLMAMRSELQAQHQNPRFEVPFPTMNLGYIRGGDNPNRICAHCEMQIDLRPLPGMALDELREMLRKRVALAVDESGLDSSITPLFEGIEAMETPAASAIVQACEELTGYSAEAVAFGTEGPHLEKLGMDTVILGPGDISQAHKPDESLAMTTIDPTVRLLHQLIRKFCLAAD